MMKGKNCTMSKSKTFQQILRETIPMLPDFRAEPVGSGPLVPIHLLENGVIHPDYEVWGQALCMDVMTERFGGHVLARVKICPYEWFAAVIALPGDNFFYPPTSMNPNRPSKLVCIYFAHRGEGHIFHNVGKDSLPEIKELMDKLPAQKAPEANCFGLISSKRLTAQTNKRPQK